MRDDDRIRHLEQEVAGLHSAFEESQSGVLDMGPNGPYAHVRYAMPHQRPVVVQQPQQQQGSSGLMLAFGFLLGCAFTVLGLVAVYMVSWSVFHQ